eukprot:CAMPEP_0172945848 /NCGR_PEP_ID=MMETSP1075-20121228/226763_1 /TAXON_ID=2916 /ORGANISM="Ceratium fusus, Strain PA161109" /LENGTH=210 /DNA_ID=CAMNT_0013807293 /DNA_START=65 /DNA_END=698 /DNA_ORIENTATION=-
MTNATASNAVATLADFAAGLVAVLQMLVMQQWPPLPHPAAWHAFGGDHLCVHSQPLHQLALAPDFVLDGSFARCTIVSSDLNGTCSAKLHDLIAIDNCATCVLLIDDINAGDRPPLPPLLRANGRFHLPDVCVNLLHSTFHRPTGLIAGASFSCFVLHRAAHLAEAETLHCLLSMSVLRCTAHYYGSVSLTVKGRLKQQRQLRVTKRHPW